MKGNKKKYIRRKRHREKSKLRKRDAVRSHKRTSGRTGSIWKKHNHSTRHFTYGVLIPNMPTWYPKFSDI